MTTTTQQTHSKTKLPFGFIKQTYATTKPFIGSTFYSSPLVKAVIEKNTLSGAWFIRKTENNPKRIFSRFCFYSVKSACEFAGTNFENLQK